MVSILEGRVQGVCEICSRTAKNCSAVQGNIATGSTDVTGTDMHGDSSAVSAGKIMGETQHPIIRKEPNLDG
jgi:hypothetical protein